MHATIQDVARATGLTSRTLRHYDAIGLLPATATGAGGMRLYDDAALARLQRILLLREAGLGLAAIQRAFATGVADVDALAQHVALLRDERDRLDRRIRSVERTVHSLRHGEPLMTTTTFDGFDHTRYRQEVEERWGADAYARSDAWWRGLSAADKQKIHDADVAIVAELDRLVAGDADPAGPDATRLLERHRAWVAAAWGGTASDEAYLGLVDMYVADERFADHYGGVRHAEFLRTAARAADPATDAPSGA
ncbi:MAG: MerR family transcriptional regulator [Microcella sp.]